MKRTYAKLTRDSKDFITLVFIFSLIAGMVLTTYLASRTIGVGSNIMMTQAAGPQH